MSNIKQELEKIEIPKELHERTKLGVKKAQLEGQRKRKIKNPFVAAAIASVLGIGLLLSPATQAMFEGLFQVTKFEKSAHNEELSFGYGFDNLGIHEEKVYDSLSELENTFNINVPFPKELLLEENNKKTLEYSAITDDKGEFSSYRYDLSTQERSYAVFATNKADAEARFSAATTDGTGVDKDIVINGIPSKLLGINEIDGYAIYIENDNWKLIITVFDRANGLEGLSDVTENEVIKIAESIKW